MVDLGPGILDDFLCQIYLNPACHCVIWRDNYQCSVDNITATEKLRGGRINTGIWDILVPFLRRL